MKRKSKLFLSLASMMFAVALLCFGVYAALSVSYGISGSVVYQVQDVFVDIETRLYSSSTVLQYYEELEQNVNILNNDSGVKNFPKDNDTYSPNGFNAELLNKNVQGVYNHKFSSLTDIQTQNTGTSLNLEYGLQNSINKFAYYVVVQITNLSDITLYATVDTNNLQVPENSIFYQPLMTEINGKVGQQVSKVNMIFAFALDDPTSSIDAGEFKFPVLITKDKPVDNSPALVLDDYTMKDYVYETENLNVNQEQYKTKEIVAGQENSIQIINPLVEYEQNTSNISKISSTYNFSTMTKSSGDELHQITLKYIANNFSMQGVPLENITYPLFVNSYNTNIKVFDNSNNQLQNVNFSIDEEKITISNIDVSNFNVEITYPSEFNDIVLEYSSSVNGLMYGKSVQLCLTSDANMTVTYKNKVVREVEIKELEGIKYFTTNLQSTNYSQGENADIDLSILVDGNMSGNSFSNINILDEYASDLGFNAQEIVQVFVLDGKYETLNSNLDESALIGAGEYDGKNATFKIKNVPLKQNLTIVVLFTDSSFLTMCEKVKVAISVNEDKFVWQNKGIVSTQEKEYSLPIGTTSNQMVTANLQTYTDESSGGTMNYLKIDVTLKNLTPGKEKVKISLYPNQTANILLVAIDKGTVVDFEKMVYFLLWGESYAVTQEELNQLDIISFGGVTTEYNALEIYLSNPCPSEYSFTIVGFSLEDILKDGFSFSLSASFCSVNPLNYVLNNEKTEYYVDSLDRIDAGIMIENKIWEEGYFQIPKTYMGLPVTKINEGIFVQIYQRLDHLDIQANLKEIANNTFSQFYGLQTINLSNCTNVTTIGDSAFSNCTNLQSIDLSGCTSLTTIGNQAFDLCSNLAKISVPKSLTTIGSDVFYGCSELQSIDLSGCTNLTTIKDYAFRSCSMTEIIIPQSVETIGNDAFWGCELTKVTYEKEGSGYTFKDGVLTINAMQDEPAWYNDNINPLVTEIVWNCSPTNIGNYAFYGCSSLTEITIPDSVTTIGEYAFSFCFSLTEITIPENVTTVENLAFNVCIKLNIVTIENLAIANAITDKYSQENLLNHLQSGTGVVKVKCSSLEYVTSTYLINNFTATYQDGYAVFTKK